MKCVRVDPRMPDLCSRRHYLGLAAAAGTLGVAGCSRRPYAGGSSSGNRHRIDDLKRELDLLRELAGGVRADFALALGGVSGQPVATPSLRLHDRYSPGI